SPTEKKSHALLLTRMETIALRCRRAIMFWRCRGDHVRTCVGRRNHSPLSRIRLSASIWILLLWTSGEPGLRNDPGLIDAGPLRFICAVCPFPRQPFSCEVVNALAVFISVYESDVYTHEA